MGNLWLHASFYKKMYRIISQLWEFNSAHLRLLFSSNRLWEISTSRITVLRCRHEWWRCSVEKWPLTAHSWQWPPTPAPWGRGWVSPAGSLLMNDTEVTNRLSSFFLGLLIDCIWDLDLVTPQLPWISNRKYSKKL